MFSVCILIYVCMYLCIYIATHLQTLYLDWLQAVLESNSTSTRKWRLSELRDILRGRDRAGLEMHLETEIGWTQRCTWRPGSSECGDTFGDRDRVNSEMHLEAMIERVWRCTWRPWSCGLAGRNRASLEIQLEAVIERVWRCTCRPWSSEIGRVLGGGRWTAHRVMRLYSSVS